MFGAGPTAVYTDHAVSLPGSDSRYVLIPSLELDYVDTQPSITVQGKPDLILASRGLCLDAW